MATLVPRVRPGVDFRKLPLDPTDGFVLTRVDGASSVKAIAQNTGLPEFSVEASIEKLKGLGVLELIDPSKPPPATPAAAPAAARVASAGTAGRTQRYPESELDEECDLDRDHRRQILDLFYDLEDLDHYTLLGVTQDAEKKAIKRAYYDIASRLHPDRFFRKALGSFKPKMEVVFAKITTAHETLTSNQAREEYDAYLRDVVSTRSLEAQLARAQEELRAAAAEYTEVQPSDLEPAPRDSERDLRARREALARRLGRPVAAAPPPPAPVEPPRQDSARFRTAQENRDTVKRMYEDRVSGAKKAQVKKYADMAHAALAKNDVVAAAAAFRMALGMDETDEELRRLYEDTEAKAAVILVDSYLKTAQYEERSEKFAEAARSWSKVSQIRMDDPVPAEAAARCTLLAKGNLHQAADLAKRAIELAPSVVKYRITLAKVYIAANLMLAAKRELEGAAKLDPSSQSVAELLKGLASKTA